ncbi:MAG: CvpA family protein [Patescibacteria group bacterium]|nr:CvpA family protein [Patescibacteria group bacterium]
MYLTILDLVLILSVFSLIAVGFAMGLIQAIGGLVGLFLGAWVAGLYYGTVSGWLVPFFLGNDLAARITAFILIFTIINRLVGLVFYLVGKVFNLVSIIPFTKTINRMLGAALGLIEAIFSLGLMLSFAQSISISPWLGSIIESSKIATWLIGAAQILMPFVPKVISKISTVL